MLDIRVYEVEYADGYITSLSANTISENMMAQVDEEGNRFQLLAEIIDHKSDATAVSLQDAFLITTTGTKRRRETTKGW